MKLKAGLMALSLAFTSFLAACGSENTSGNADSEVKDDALQIYTTIYPLQDFAAKIGGEHVKVESILPPGVDAHTFEPTPKTMVTLAKADAFIYSGAGVEGFVEAAKDTLKSEDVKLVEAAHGIELAHHDEHGTEEAHDEHAAEESHDEHAAEETHDEHDHGDVDPHIWLDPILAIELAENIKTELTELKPEAKEDFEKNFETLKSDLETLDKEFTQVIESAPKKEILVAHAAYGYWEGRYGIEQLSVSGLSPTSEPSQKELQNLVSTAKEHGIKYVIFEQNATPKIAELVKKEIGADSLTLHNLEAVTEEDIKNKEDYFSIMKKNLETLKTALQ
ncbi:metal ABC transporter solute-binding protein, Zn/Mn family [Priestia abyssalis]|uniref:metal ABC transporter solute-binding protein, Zn/Mn family n=1 Tax=Priestia abyssalis TaxID=1221450 RepID=UPI000995B36C|nr:zinc ABC transporter substrate-binding protein [Priestia abyssalis]